jgi:hypothetical protein
MALAKRYAVTSKEMAPTLLAIGVIDNTLRLMKPSKKEGKYHGWHRDDKVSNRRSYYSGTDTDFRRRQLVLS